MSNFDRAFEALLKNEGGYSNNPNDPGGETMWGITLLVARTAGYYGPMAEMPQSTAKGIYHTKYWRAWMDTVPYAVAFQVFDGSVNSGEVQAVKWLQRAAGVKDDGLVGPVTLAAVKVADPVKLAVKFNTERLEFLTGLPNWQHFGRGWARRIAENLEKAVA